MRGVTGEEGEFGVFVSRIIYAKSLIIIQIQGVLKLALGKEYMRTKVSTHTAREENERALQDMRE